MKKILLYSLIVVFELDFFFFFFFFFLFSFCFRIFLHHRHMKPAFAQIECAHEAIGVVA
jgi:hypothetical protein